MRRNRRSLASPTRAGRVRTAKCGYAAGDPLYRNDHPSRPWARRRGRWSDQHRGRKTIDAPVLVVDESSMIPVDLLAAVVKHNSAEHTFSRRCGPIAACRAGNPFADLIAKDRIAITRLEHNHRTDVKGIRALTRAINRGCAGDVRKYAIWAVWFIWRERKRTGALQRAKSGGVLSRRRKPARNRRPYACQCWRQRRSQAQ